MNKRAGSIDCWRSFTDTYRLGFQFGRILRGIVWTRRRSLLDYVSEFVRKQPLSSRGGLGVLSGTENDMICDSVGAGPHAGRGFFCFAAGVYADLWQLVTEARFVLATISVGQRSAGIAKNTRYDCWWTRRMERS